MKLLTFFIILLICAIKMSAQSYTIQLQVTGQQEKKVVIGKIRGDKFIPLDSLLLHLVTSGSPAESGQKDNRQVSPGHQVNFSIVTFQFPENATPGMYRLILGKTRVAQIMNEPPQQLDFIFNHENIAFETDFKAPEDNLKIILSEENKVWFGFKKQEKVLKSQIKELEMEVNYYQAQGVGVSNSDNAVTNCITRYNRLQKGRDSLITKTSEQHPNLFAAKLIKMYREPFLEGNLTEQQRKEVFKNEFFNQRDFTDKSLINTSIYTERAFQYLMAYAQKGLTREQQEQEFLKATEIILEATHPMTSSNWMNNDNIYEFILDFLVRGFEKMNLEKVLKSIANKYEGTTCQTDEKTTLERRLAFLKFMTVGATVPDFTLPDIIGDPVTLSRIQEEKTLLIFWASWCPHCNEMLPQIKNWQKQNKDVELVAVSLDTSEMEWKNKVTELGIESWYNLSDLKGWDGEIATKYNIYATPTLVVIGKDLKIISLPVNINEF